MHFNFSFKLSGTCKFSIRFTLWQIYVFLQNENNLIYVDLIWYNTNKVVMQKAYLGNKHPKIAAFETDYVHSE